MDDMEFWIATVSDEGNVYASTVILGYDMDADTVMGFAKRDMDIRDALSDEPGATLHIHGPYLTNAAAEA